MALLDYEHWGRETNPALSGWFTVASSVSISADGLGPYGIGRYAQPSGALGRQSVFPNTTSNLYAQFHMFVTGPGSDHLFSWYDANNTQCSLRIDNTGVITLVRGTAGTTIATSGTPAIAWNAWYFIQLRVTIGAAGSYELRINGQTIFSGTGNTQNTANNYANGWNLRWARYANLILYDGTGNAPNTWTPETVIYTSLPNGAGATTGWTPSAGANWQCVDEQPNNGDTDYVAAASAPLTDTYACPAPAPSGVIPYAVGVEVVARKDDAGTNDLDLVVRSGGSDYASGVPGTLTTTWQRFRRIWDLDPDTGLAWTLADAHAVQPGVRRTA